MTSDYFLIILDGKNTLNHEGLDISTSSVKNERARIDIKSIIKTTIKIIIR